MTYERSLQQINYKNNTIFRNTLQKKITPHSIQVLAPQIDELGDPCQQLILRSGSLCRGKVTVFVRRLSPSLPKQFSSKFPRVSSAVKERLPLVGVGRLPARYRPSECLHRKFKYSPVRMSSPRFVVVRSECLPSRSHRCHHDVGPKLRRTFVARTMVVSL